MFGRRRRPSISLPFSAERLNVLSTIIFPLAVRRALKLRQSSIITVEDVWRSAFLNSYVNAYPSFMDEYDNAIGSAIRSLILRASFEATDTEAKFRFQAYQLSLENKDRATIEAATLGYDDGAFYFRRLLANTDADERATANLTLAIRGMETFPIFLPGLH